MCEDIKMTLRGIIKKLCKDKGISVNKLEAELGFAKGYVSKLDKSKPNSAKLQQIADYFGVSLDYLMTGKESVSVDMLYSDENADFIIEVTNKAKDKDFVNRMMKYMSLMDENKKSVDDMIDFMYNKENKGAVK